MAFELRPLPYAFDALEPHMSGETLKFHHGKHHRAYVDKLNELVAATALADCTLEDVIRSTAKDDARAAIFNNAAQVWNHDFFWHSMRPAGGGMPSREVGAMIDRDFGGFNKFRDAFVTAAETQFGSGWVWLVVERGKLKVTKTGNADTPIAHRHAPLLACDVWEHAYYLDYRNRRGDFARVFLDLLTDWNFVTEGLTRHARSKAA